MTPRILLVDDEPRNLSLLEALLTRFPCETLRASRGKEALELIARTPVDLVLLDLRMPEMDGIEVLKVLRAQDSTAHLPVVIVTASSEREERLRGLRAGADDFIEKPVDAEVLLARVRTLLGFKAARDELAARNVALEELQREQRELTDMIVHDLKNPIGVATLCLDFALLPEITDFHARLEVLHDAADAVRKMNSLAEQLVLISRLERAEFPIQPEPLAVDALLDKVGRAFLHEAEQRKVSLEVQTHPDLTVSADQSLLRRVIENLVSNALRHTPTEGKVKITSNRARDVEIMVSNTGSYIEREHRQHIFKKFWRDPKVTEITVHAGLGLYFCRRAVEAHGGRIEVVDTQSHSTNFLVQLPT